MYLIDADALEKDGWSLSRNRKVDDKTMVYEVRKPTEFPTVERERKTGKWITQEFGSWAECSECHELYDIPIAYSNFCPNCGSYNGGQQNDSENNDS